MSTGICTVYGTERKLGAQNASSGNSAPESGPNKSGQGAHEQPDRTESQSGHHKHRSWKDVDSSLPSARRPCAYPEAPCSKRKSAQAPSDVHEISLCAPQEATNLTINDLPTDALATILRKTLHPKYPGAIWGRNLNPAVQEARWFLMDGRNQSHRVLDKFPQDACVSSAQTCHIMRAAQVCKRWKRIIYGEEGPGVVEHVAVTGQRMATRLPTTVKTLFIHGQNSDPMWRLVSKGGLSLLESVLTMRSRRSKDFMHKLSTCCPNLKHVGITSPADGSEALRTKDLVHLARLPQLSALELVDCEAPASLEPLGGATSLRRLTLRCCGGVSGADLTALSRLNSLQLFVVEDLDIGVEGFRAISALPDLRSLILTSCDGIDRSGLELLCGMSNLQYLDMSDVWEFAGDTLQPLASLTNLQVLALTDCENLQSSHLAVLRWLQQLKSLDLSRCARVDAFGMRHLTHLTSLSALSLQGCEGVDSRAIKYLRDVPTLKRLNLTACRGVQTAAMRHLRHLTNLEVLSIADLVRVGNGALKYFCSLSSLRTLYVAGCPHITEDGLQLLRHHPVHVYT